MIVWVLLQLNYDMHWDIEAIFASEKAAIEAKEGLSGSWVIQPYQVQP